MRPTFFILFLLGLSISLSAQYCIEGRFDDSLFTKGQLILNSDVKYGEAVGWQDTLRDLFLDVYAPDPLIDTLDKRPLIIYAHGGGFHAGSKTTNKSVYWSAEFAKRGFVAAAIDYRVGWPNQDSCAADTTLYLEALYRGAQDARAAWRYLIENAEDYNIDTNQIYFLGSSAGAAMVLMTTYMNEGDFPEVIVSKLGPLETSGNSITGHPINVKGIITKSAAIDNDELLDNASVPHLLFHGNCDLTVPYFEGPIFYCYAPDKFVEVIGSGLIADGLEARAVCYTLYQSLGNGHTAAKDDTVLIYGGEFIKSILCDNCETKRWSRLSGKNICKDNAGNEVVVDLIYPVPADQTINVVVSVPFREEVLFRLYNMNGQLFKTISQLFEVPTDRVRLDVSDVPPGSYLLRVGNKRQLNGHIVLVN